MKSTKPISAARAMAACALAATVAAPALADLTIASVEFPRGIMQGDCTTAVLTLQSSVPVPRSFQIGFEENTSGQTGPGSAWSTVKTVSVSPFDAVTQVTITGLPIKNMNNKYRFHVDSNHVIAESEEYNNTANIAQPTSYCSRLAVKDVTATEGSTATFNVALAPANRYQAVTVNYHTPAITATWGGSCGSGADFAAQGGTLRFEPGETMKTVSVPTCTDRFKEAPETFAFKLSSPTNAVLTNSSSAVGTITDASQTR